MQYTNLLLNYTSLPDLDQNLTASKSKNQTSLPTGTNTALMYSLGKHDNPLSAFEKYLMCPIEELKPFYPGVFQCDSKIRDELDGEEFYDMYYIYSIVKDKESNEYFARPSDWAAVSLSLPGDWTMTNPPKDLVKQAYKTRQFSTQAFVPYDSDDFELAPTRDGAVMLLTPKPVDLVKLTYDLFKEATVKRLKTPQDPKEVEKFTIRSLSYFFLTYDGSRPHSLGSWSKYITDYISEQISPNCNLEEYNKNKEQERLNYSKEAIEFAKKHIRKSEQTLKRMEDNVTFAPNDIQKEYADKLIAERDKLYKGSVMFTSVTAPTIRR